MEFKMEHVDKVENRCGNCRHWNYLHTRTYEDKHSVDLGECRIRSVNMDCFPERFKDEACGEHES